MKKQVIVNLFGARGKRQVDISTKGGFPTRHINAPRETVPSIFAPVNSKPAPGNPKSKEGDHQDEVAPPTLLEVMKWMHASDNHSGWLIIDEILFVATTQYKMKFNQDSLLDALRLLYREGCLVYRLNRFDQHTFRLIESQENHLKSLLVEVDAILTKGGTV